MTDPDRWVLGLDGGGSKTALAYLGPGGQLSGPVYAPGVNPFDRPDWAAVLTAFVRAHPAPGPLAYATLGLPGYGESPAVSAEQDAVCRALIDAPHTVMNDVQAAFLGAFPGGVGALVLAGTGSMAWASDGARHVRAGGWGDGFGDEGSAYWIGRSALSLASRALDGRHPDAAFAHALLHDVLGGDVTPARLLDWHHRLPHVRSGVAALARTVDDLAAGGQPTAAALLEAAAHELAQHVHAVRAQLGHPALPWSYAGSVTGSRAVRAALTRELASEPVRPALPPLGGPLSHAAVRAGHDLPAVLAALVPALRGDAAPIPSPPAPRAQEHA